MPKKNPHTPIIPLILLVFLIFRHTYDAFGQGDQESSRTVCGFQPSKAEDLTSDPESILAWNQMDLQIAKIARASRPGKTSRSVSSQVVLKVPIVVHLVYSSTTPGTLANLTDSQVQGIINQVNANLRHTSGNTYTNPFSGADAAIEFCFATQDPNGNPTNGIDRHHDPVNSTYNSSTQNVQNLYQWPKDDYMNIYYVDNASANITYPYGLESIVCWGYTAKVLTHEAGHFFGLFHPFNGGCTNGNCDLDGDKICDTPPTTSGGSGIPVCPPSAMNTCTTDSQDTDPRNPYRSVALGGLGDVNDLWENYMYTSLSCAEAFTQGQAQRMRTVLLGAVTDPLRAPYKLLESTKCGSVSPIVRQANAGNQLCTTTGFYEQTITLVYLNPPQSGKLSVNGQLFNITPDAEGIQTVSLKDLPADGNPVMVTVLFTAEPTYTFDFPDLFTAPTLANCQVAPCEITQIVLDYDPSCNPANNTYGAQFRIFYENAPPGQGANLELYVNNGLGAQELSYSSPEVLAVSLPADGQPATVKAQFTANPACSLVVSNMYTAPNPGCVPNTCSISDLVAGSQGSCNPANNTYTQVVTVYYTMAPGSGSLVVNNQSFAITSSPQTVTLTGLVSNGAPVNVEAHFSANTGCSRTENGLFTAPANCTPCSISDLVAGSQGSCHPTNNTYTQQVTVYYTMAPGSGSLVVNNQSFAIAPSPQTVTLTGLVSNGAPVNVEAHFSANTGCSRTENGLFTAPANCTPCSISDLIAGSQGSCNPANNTYTQQVTVHYTMAPGSGSLVVNNQSFAIASSPQTVTLIGLISDALPVNVEAHFSSNTGCSRTENALFMAPANCTPCSISDLVAGSQGSCNPANNTYTQQVTVYYMMAPGSGSLVVNNQSFAIASSPQTVTLTGLISDALPVNVEAHFSANTGCSRTENALFTAPANCTNSCLGTYTNVCSDDFIDDFTFGSFSNLNSGCGGTLPNNYSDYRGGGPSVEAGQTYPVTVGVGPNYAEFVGLYIDLNQNGSYLDDGEFFDMGQAAAGSTVTLNVLIPGNATLGNSNMRVRISYNAPLMAADGCTTNLEYGEIEDYSIDIMSPSGCVTTSNLMVDNPVIPGTYQGNVITSSGMLSGSPGAVHFRAANAVNLEPNFEAISSKVFTVGIDPCVCVLSQWALSASATSYYNLEQAPNFYPEQATGAPDVNTCGDNPKAWAPLTNADIPEYLRLNYQTPVKASGVRIYETNYQFGNGFVYKVEFVDVNDQVHIVWQGDDDVPCGGVFSPDIEPTNYLVKSVIVHTQVFGWEEIDAVELIGAVCPN